MGAAVEGAVGFDPVAEDLAAAVIADRRQPVNRASVELIFDNSLGRAAGQWSSYAEISVKRVLARDSESTSYYINNTHVRRRDVADIFLGPGLGARRDQRRSAQLLTTFRAPTPVC